ncbi:MAG: FAD/NAD(P)-binding protein, partial [Chloroflexota bacterium]
TNAHRGHVHPGYPRCGGSAWLSWPVEKAVGYDVVIVAGGIGLAPLRPALYHILAHRELYGKIVLLYGTRSPEDILFRRELESWRSRFDLDVYVTVDYADARWRGNIGVVTTLIPKAPFDPLHTIALVCGPEVMMRFTAQGLLKRGVALDNIYVSLERNMKCAIGFCGHCQFGPHFICKDGPVYAYSRIDSWLTYWEI